MFGDVRAGAKPYWRRDYLNRLFPVPVPVKRRMPNYDAYLDRSPEASYDTTGLRLALIFRHGRIFVLVHKLEVRLLQSMHTEIFVTRQQALAAKAKIDANEHYNKISIDIA